MEGSNSADNSNKNHGHAGAPYLSYLLRMWSISVEGEARVWRASVQSPLTQEESHFQDLESLFAFLRMMTESSSATDQKPAPKGEEAMK